MTTSQNALNFITNAIENKLDVYVSTPLRHTKITPSNYAKWEKLGISLFKIDAEGNLRMASGKNYNIIATTSQVLVKITAQ